VALAAHGVIAHGGQLRAMRIMAIGAGYSFMIHLALNERAVFIIFFQDLTIGIIDTFL
jgi:hypothetical protein